jgi:hypothetical protein
MHESERNPPSSNFLFVLFCSGNNSICLAGRKGWGGFLCHAAQFISLTDLPPRTVGMLRSAQYLGYGVRSSIPGMSKIIFT